MSDFDDVNESGKSILEIFAERQRGSAGAVDMDFEEHLPTSGKLGGGKVPQHFDVGNFGHTYAENLIPSLPKGLDKEVTIELPDGSKKRLDRVDRKNGIIYEVKPDTPASNKAGKKQVKNYVEIMNREYPLGNNRKWKGKVVTYNRKAVVRLLKSIGWIKTKPSVTAKSTPKTKAAARKVFVDPVKKPASKKKASPDRGTDAAQRMTDATAVDKTKSKTKPKVKPKPKLKPKPKVKPKVKPVVKPKVDTKAKLKATDNPLTANKVVDTVKPGLAADATLKPDVVPDQAPNVSNALPGKPPAVKPGLKSVLKNPKVKFSLKVGGGILLDIGVGILISLGESGAMQDGWKAIEPKLIELAQKELDKVSESGEIAKFRNGEKLENGYQLYYKIQLGLVTRCSDGFFGYNRYFVRFELQTVQILRNTGKTHIPETGNACGEGGDQAVIYAPIFDNGEYISSGTADAADEKFQNISSTLNKNYVANRDKKNYLQGFYRYTQLFKDSKAAIVWAEMLADIRFVKLLVGLDMSNPWDLFEGGMPFVEIMETVPWLGDADYHITFMKAFLTFAEQWATQQQKTAWKKYYDKLAAYKRGSRCHSNCHDLNSKMINDRALLDIPPTGSRLSSPKYDAWLTK